MSKAKVVAVGKKLAVLGSRQSGWRVFGYVQLCGESEPREAQMSPAEFMAVEEYRDNARLTRDVIQTMLATRSSAHVFARLIRDGKPQTVSFRPCDFAVGWKMPRSAGLFARVRRRAA
jgi:hypothetical protein